eukprot:2424459-Rhodomonas_salina.1
MDEMHGWHLSFEGGQQPGRAREGEKGTVAGRGGTEPERTPVSSSAGLLSAPGSTAGVTVTTVTTHAEYRAAAPYSTRAIRQVRHHSPAAPYGRHGHGDVRVAALARP